jgi:hypothetical protein
MRRQAPSSLVAYKAVHVKIPCDADDTSRTLAWFGARKKVFRFFRARKLSNFFTTAADEQVHVRACSKAPTPACTVPDLLSLFEKKYQKVPTVRHTSNPTEY